MEKVFKTILYTILVFATIFIIAKALFFLLPFIIVAVAIIYIYGKVKSKSKSRTYSHSESSIKQTIYTTEDNEVEDVVDVDYKEVD